MAYGILIILGFIALGVLWVKREKLLRIIEKTDTVFPRGGSGPKYPRQRDDNDDL